MREEGQHRIHAKISLERHSYNVRLLYTVISSVYVDNNCMKSMLPYAGIIRFK